MRPGLQRAARVAVAGYLLAIAAVVLAPAPALETPARDVATSLTPNVPDPDPQPMEQVERVGFRRLDTFGNVLLFVPLGVLVAVASRVRARTHVVATGAFAAVLELLQLTAFRDRRAQLSDVLLDTAGSAIGFAGARLLDRARRRRARG